MHDHEIFHLSDLKRRDFLKASTISVGALFLNSFESIAADAATVSLPGFSAFSKSVKISKNSKYYLVESDGMPNHAMMAGIVSWQQQVPTPQPYTGSNAWSIPIKPVLSKSPISAKNHFLRGAIAIAVNGVPIFNALNNRGDDALLAGELDDWGGHCGRADDYHYHIAPLHLQSLIGKKVPIAYALDGYPIYGDTEVDGKPVTKLDEFNGHFDVKKNYHYHGTKTYPYINGGFKGIVQEIDGQVSPQAMTRAFRPAGEPLKGAKILSCQRIGNNDFDFIYELSSQKYEIKYSATLNEVNMTFISPDGSSRIEKYSRK